MRQFPLNDILPWLELRLVPGMNRARYHGLLQGFRHPADVFNASFMELKSRCRLDSDFVKSILDSPAINRAPEHVERLAAIGAEAISRDDPRYPVNLRQSATVPPLLFVRGKLIPEDRASIALVGSRKSTTYGRSVAEDFSRELSRYGITVISGFARGIDTAAHQAALKAGGRTIAALGCGLDICYPAENAGLVSRIVAQGALISEYPLGVGPQPFHFPERNVMLALLSLGTLVVEAAERSGALITAREAIDANRLVFAIPGDITRSHSAGCNRLILQGAQLTMRPIEILREMRDTLRHILPELAVAIDAEEKAADLAKLQSKEQAKPTPDNAATNGPAAPPRPLGSYTPHEARVLEILAREALSFDVLFRQLDDAEFTPQKLNAMLFKLELSGALKQLPGRVYQVSL